MVTHRVALNKGQELMVRCLERGCGWLCPSCIKEGERGRERAVERWRKSPGIILMKSRVSGRMEAGRDLYSRYVKNGWPKEKGESNMIPMWSH